MKLIHCADIHLDSRLSANLDGEKRKKRKNELLENFVNMISWAKVNDIEAIIIAGDLFDTSNITRTTAALVKNCIAQNPQISFYYLKGNHDVQSFLYGMEEDYPNLFLFGEEWTKYYIGKDKSIVISGVELNKDNSNLIYDSLVLEPDKYNIVTLHGQNSMYQQKDKSEVINITGLRNKSIDYLALGHIHSYMEEQIDGRGVYCYPGCLEGRGFDECGQHGFVELIIDENTYEAKRRFVPWGTRQLYEVYCDVSECMDSLDAVRIVRKCINEEGADSKDLIKVVITGQVDSEADINADFIAHELEDEYFFLKVKDESGIRIDIDKYLKDVSLKGEFIRQVMADESLAQETKMEIIKTGLLALSGEDF